MKKFISLLLSLVLVITSICTMTFSAFAQKGVTYYVDSFFGNDSNSGTNPQQAWKSISTHSDFLFNPGDTICLKAGGVYSGTFMPSSSGTKENPITICSYGDVAKDGKPVMMSLNNNPTVFLLNINGYVVKDLDFTAKKNGAGIKIFSVNSKDLSEFDHYKSDSTETTDNHSSDNSNASNGLVSKIKGIIDFFSSKIGWILGINLNDKNTDKYSDLPDSFIISDFVITNCSFHDIAFYEDTSLPSELCPIEIVSSGKGARVDNVTISDIDITDCRYGISIDGLSVEFNPELFKSESESYNNNILIENVNFNHIGYDAIILGSIYNGTVRNCYINDTCLYDDHYTAPVWTHNCDYVVIENCEVSGAKNWMDAMTIDFDGWTQNTVYQYIYSHDNVSFMKNNTYDNTTKNRNNTVRYCLSVNDNKFMNFASLPNATERYPFNDRSTAMENFKFYNNTIINVAPTFWGILQNSIVANNIFIGDESGLSDISLALGFNTSITNNCFYGMNSVLGSKNNYTCNPGFVETDLSNKDSFKLSEDSELIGKGIKVEDNMGDHDFYGNRLTDTHNIGCYDGQGENEKAQDITYNNTIIEKVILAIKKIADFLIQML